MMNRKNFGCYPKKDLYILSYERWFMNSPENTPEFTIHEYGSDVILALKDIKLKYKDTTYKGVHILEEAEPLGTQHLKTGDIIKEIDKLPQFICKYISVVVLFPFACPYEEDGDDPIFADAKWHRGQVTIYAIPQDRSVLKDVLAHHHTLAHEAGHIMDREIMQHTGHSSNYLSYTPQWAKAMCEDSRIKRSGANIPSYLVSQYAEKRQSIGEDFADSVKCFSFQEGRAFLKGNFPNRYKILEEFLEPKTQ